MRRSARKRRVCPASICGCTNGYQMIKNRAKEKPAKPQPKPEKGYGEWNDEEALQASSNQDRDADFLDDFF